MRCMNIGERRSSALFVRLRPDELAPFAKADGAMGPKVTAVSGYVKRCGKPAWIGALSRIDRYPGGQGGNLHPSVIATGGDRECAAHAVYLSLLCAQIMPLAYSPGRSGESASRVALRRDVSLSVRFRWPTFRPGRTALSYQCRCTSGSFSQS
ncbi:carbamate kinase [Salmonella enterica subsp. enterica]|nr:carbamate kinase [Salmonella enterica subsp. enterica]